MTRVSTAGSYAQMLANIQAAQARQNDAGAQVSSQKNATDYKGYAAKAEVLTAMRGVQTKVDGFIDQSKALGVKLQVQASGLGQVSAAATGARESIANAVAADNADTLMQELQGHLTDAVSGMNARHNGHYVFAGGLIDTKPVTATTLADLTAAPAISNLFQNDQFKTTSRLDENTTVQSGYLASDVGTGLLTQLKAIQAYVDTNGPFSGTLTDAQKTFLQSTLSGFDSTYAATTAVEASNGVLQNQVDASQTDLSNRKDMLEGMTGDITDADLSQAISNLQAAQVSLQASAQVFATLKQTSLLEILSQ